MAHLISGIGRVVEELDDVLPGPADLQAGGLRVGVQLEEDELQNVEKALVEEPGYDITV